MKAPRLALAMCALVAALLVVAFGREAHAQILSPGPLSRAHASIEGDTHCNDCHSSGKRVDQGACLRCHADLGARIAAGAGLHGTQFRGKACEGCHVEHLGVGVSLSRWDPQHFDHGQTGWTLEGAHKTATCNRCHTRAPKFVGLSTTCTTCHKDKHEGRFGANCTSCHDQAAWLELRVGQDFNHELSRFPLRGAHKTVACAKCHFEPPRYVGLKFGQCVDCHKDPHNGHLGAGCTDCHEDTRWKPVSFAHVGARHPGVSLANGHAGVACQRCHDRGNVAAPSRGVQCASCHRSVHKAPFGPACGTCHASILWVGLPRSVGLGAHPKTDYPLTGKHADVACVSCHKKELPQEARYRKLAFSRCSDCHADQHRGEFASADRVEWQAVPLDERLPPHALRHRVARLDALPARRQARGVGLRRLPHGGEAAGRPPRGKAGLCRLPREPPRGPVRQGDGAGRLRALPRAARVVPAQDRPQHVAAHRRPRDGRVRELPPPDRRGPQGGPRRELPWHSA
jgi:hypothetical protein